MKISSLHRYQKLSKLWINILLVALPLFIVLGFTEAGNIIGLIFSIFSAFGLLFAWLYKKYSVLYEQAFQRFDKLPTLATWSVSTLAWKDYGHVELEHRRRGLLKYVWWSPVIVVALAFMIWAEEDDLAVDINLLWYGLAGYVFFMLILLIAFRVKRAKVQAAQNQTTDHIISLKTSGAVIDDDITLWGRVVANEHRSFFDSLLGALFLVSDEHRKLLSANFIEEAALHYLFITYKMDEQNQADLYLPIPEIELDRIKTLTENIAIEPAPLLETDPGQTKFKTMTYVKIIGGLIAVGGVVVWLVQDVWPLYHQWKSESYFNEGVKADARGSYDSAVALYRKAIDQYPEMPEPYLNIGVYFMNSNQPDSALQYYNLTLQRNPEFDLAMANKGVLLYSINQYEASNEVFKRFSQLKPDDHSYDIHIADNYFNLKKYDSALLHYQRAYSEDKKTAVLCYMIGYSLYQQELFSEAIAPLEESISMDANNADSHQLLGDVYEHLGKSDEAAKYHELASRVVVEK